MYEARLVMKVTHLNTLSSGGAARAVARIHDGISVLGYDSQLYTLNDKEGGNRSIRFKVPRDIVSRVAYRWKRRTIDRDFAAYWSTRPRGLEPFSDDRTEFCLDVLHQLPDCDLIHLHWVSGFLDYVSFFSSWRKPVVWTLHDMNPFTGGCHYNMGCDRLNAACGCCPQLGSVIESDFSHAVWKRKHRAFTGMRPGQMHIVATSRWMQSQAKESSLLSPFPVSVIPLGLDTEAFAPSHGAGMRSSLGIPERACVILFAADSLENKRKGFAELLQALESVVSEHEIFLLTVGGSKPELDCRFRHMHLGYIQSDQLLAAVYNASDVFVIPSLQEAFGQTALEAMSCGTPVIGFDAGGIPDMVRHGETGLLARAGDVRGLQVAISQILSDPAKRLQMSGNCRRVATEEFSLELMASRYVELYRSLLDSV